MSSANMTVLLPPFLNLIPLIFFSCLIAMARASNTTMLNSSSESGHPYLLPEFIWKGFQLFNIVEYYLDLS